MSLLSAINPNQNSDTVSIYNDFRSFFSASHLIKAVRIHNLAVAQFMLYSLLVTGNTEFLCGFAITLYLAYVSERSNIIVKAHLLVSQIALIMGFIDMTFFNPQTRGACPYETWASLTILNALSVSLIWHRTIRDCIAFIHRE